MPNNAVKWFQQSLLFSATLIILLAPKMVFSQNLAELHVLGKGRFLPSQLIDKSVTDANGQECAGLIIISDLDGLSYESYNGIVKRNHKPGQDFLFLSADERVVTVYKSGFAPLKIILSEYGIQLKKGQVWQIKITGQKQTIPINLLVQPNVKGAEIYMDSTRVDSAKTDSLKSIQATRGRHIVRIVKNGYDTYTKTINISPNNTLFTFHMKAKQLVPIEIESVPAGANIFLNNVNVGKTDTGFFRYPDKYKIRLSKTGFIDTTAQITVNAKSKNQFAFRLTPNVGKLQLIVDPKDAIVTINNKNYTGRNLISLLPGPYEIKVSKPGYYSQNETINIVLNKTTTKTYSLQAKTGTLRFSILPLDANVELQRRGNVIKSWQGLNIITGLPVGNYLLTARREGYFFVSDSVQIKADQTTVKNLNMASSNIKKKLVAQPKSPTPNKASNPIDRNSVKKGYRPPKGFRIFPIISFGLGNSYGNMGFQFEQRFGMIAFHFGIGTHVYVKQQYYSEHELISGGMKIIMGQTFDPTGGIGAEIYLDMEYGSLATPIKAYGPSVLLGGTVWLGKTIGISTAWGVSYNAYNNANDRYTVAGDVVGLALRL